MPLHETVRPLPPVASGHFSHIDPANLEAGDIIYVPSWLTFSHSTLRNAGLSVGETSRAWNKAACVASVFGPGHDPMVLLAFYANRQEIAESRTGAYTLDSAGNRVLIAACAGGNGNDLDADVPVVPPELPRTRLMDAGFMAFRLDGFADTGPDALGNLFKRSPALDYPDWLNEFRDYAANRIREFGVANFMLDESPDGAGIPDACRGTNPFVDAESLRFLWLARAILDKAQLANGGVDGSGHGNEPYELNAEMSHYNHDADWLFRSRFESLAHAGPETDSVYDNGIDLGHNAYKFVKYLAARGCAVLRRPGLRGQLLSAGLRLAAERTSARLSLFADTVRAYFPGAYRDLGATLERMITNWNDLAADNGAGWDEACAALAQIDPDTRYGRRR